MYIAQPFASIMWRLVSSYNSDYTRVPTCSELPHVARFPSHFRRALRVLHAGAAGNWKRVIGLVSSASHAALGEAEMGNVYLAAGAMQTSVFIVVRSSRPKARARTGGGDGRDRMLGSGAAGDAHGADGGAAAGIAEGLQNLTRAALAFRG